ncbi:MAG TPA: fluoride efflux transporter CrcB [Acidimicrobiales bacterium]
MKRIDGAVVLAVASGGALGALARYGIELGGGVGRDAFPWPTLGINVSGAFLLGLVYTLLAERTRPTPYLRAFLTIGLLGAYTTFSTWTAETVLLVRDGRAWIAVLYAVMTVVGGIVAVVGGVAAGRAWPAGTGGRHETRRSR